MSTALIKRFESATAELERRAADVSLEQPELWERALRALGLGQQEMAFRGLDLQAARITVAKDRLVERLSQATDVFPEGRGAGGGRPTETSVRETEVSVSPYVRQAVQTHRSDWRGVSAERREEVRERAIAEAEPLTRAAKRAARDGVPFVRQNTGKVEWYTPREIVESARKVLGGITLDPASTAKANEVVKADRFITADEDALTPDKVWGVGQGERAFINPPYASELVGRFADALGEQIGVDAVDRAIWLSNNCTETKWAAQLMALATAVCFPTGRLRFLDENLEPVGAPLQGQMILAVGGVDPDAFREEFEQYGPVAFFPDQMGEKQDVKHDIFENEIEGR